MSTYCNELSTYDDEEICHVTIIYRRFSTISEAIDWLATHEEDFRWSQFTRHGGNGEGIADIHIDNLRIATEFKLRFG